MVKQPDEILYLSKNDITSFLIPNKCIEATHSAYRDMGSDGVAKPRKSLRRSNPFGKLDSYFALLPGEKIMGGYVYSAGFSSQSPWFLLQLFDAETGKPLAILDGACLNPQKTASVSAVAIDELSRANSSTLSIFGSGVQAEKQLEYATKVRDLEQVYVYSPTKKNRESFSRRVEDKYDVIVNPVDKPSEAVELADIIITATRSEVPVFDGSKLQPGTHITAMGQYSASKRELDEKTIQRSIYVPDLRDRVFENAGSFINAYDRGKVTENDIHAGLGEIVAGNKKGRTSDDQITVFDSGGTGIETIAVANMVYQKAIDENLGTVLPINSIND